MSGVMIVTGGGRGIGAAVAREAARRGWRVCIGYRERRDAAEATSAAVRADGGEAVAVRADVAVEADVVRLFEEAEARLGPPAALVNNAGVDVPVAVADVTRAQLEQLFHVNSFGPFLCCREAVRRMSTARGGAGGIIVNVSSIAALYGGMPGDVAYAGSKAAVDALTLGLAREVAAQGIRVCGVRPGLTATEMWEDGDVPLGEVERQARALVPLGRVATPAEVAEAVLWLCSDGARYVTGALVNVSGGREINVPPAFA